MLGRLHAGLSLSLSVCVQLAQHSYVLHCALHVERVGMHDVLQSVQLQLLDVAQLQLVSQEGTVTAHQALLVASPPQKPAQDLPGLTAGASLALPQARPVK